MNRRESRRIVAYVMSKRLHGNSGSGSLLFVDDLTKLSKDKHQTSCLGVGL